MPFVGRSTRSVLLRLLREARYHHRFRGGCDEVPTLWRPARSTGHSRLLEVVPLPELWDAVLERDQEEETSAQGDVMRCGECKNCRDLEKIKSRVLACCNTIRGRNQVSVPRDMDGVIQLWNTELHRLPCLKDQEQK